MPRMLSKSPAGFALLLDVGGALDAEVRHEALVERDIVAAFAAAGVQVTPGQLAAASAGAVACFAPDAYAAIVWTLAQGDATLARRVFAAFRSGEERRRVQRGGLEVRPGVPALLESLHARGVRLGLAANQPSSALADLDRLGLAGFFAHRAVTGTHGYRKPDVRVFLAAAEALEVAPQACVRVGDRIDNDIAPANGLE